MKVIHFIGDHRRDAGAGNSGSTGIGGWAVVIILLLLLVGAGAIAYFGWTLSSADVPASGYVALAFGVIFSLVFGVGLMALVFYSSRKGYDEPAVLIQDSDATTELGTRPEPKR